MEQAPQNKENEPHEGGRTMGEYAPQPEQPASNPDALFRLHLNNALDAVAAVRTRLYTFDQDYRPKTPQQAEDMARVAEELQRMAEFLGA